MQDFFPIHALFRAAANQGKVHKPVAAERGRSNAMLLFQRVEFGDSCIAGNGIGGRAIIVINPLDEVESRLLCASNLLTPGIAGEGLEASIFWRSQTPLHNAEFRLRHEAPIPAAVSQSW
jgi:hypothetical protein